MSTERPIFVFAAGWRSGSTLMQRMLCSHPQIHVWGENRGLCQTLYAAYGELIVLDRLSKHAAREFEVLGANAWMAMLNPPAEGFLAGTAALLDVHFGRPVRRMGKSRWGFKEVRHGAEMVGFLRQVFPAAKFVLLVRDPCDCLASARATTVPGLTEGLLAEVGEAERFLHHWTRIAATFLECPHGDIALPVRYEDVLAEPEAFLNGLAAFLDVRRDGFSSKVLTVRRRGWLEEVPRLTDRDLAALDDSQLWTVAARYGYVARTAAESSQSSPSD